MRKILVFAILVAASIGGTVWAALPQVDPATVPLGALVANNSVPTPLKIGIGSKGEMHALDSGSEVFVRHFTWKPNQSSGWHTHPGPILVTIVRGTLTLYGGKDSSCTGRTYYAGSGFFDKGFGHVHAAVAGPDGADFYQIAILPPDSGDTIATAVTEGAPSCKGV